MTPSRVITFVCASFADASGCSARNVSVMTDVVSFMSTDELVLPFAERSATVSVSLKSPATMARLCWAAFSRISWWSCLATACSGERVPMVSSPVGI